MLQEWCWSDVVEDVAKVVLQKTLPQKIPSAYVASKCTSPFFLFASFSFSPKKFVKFHHENYATNSFCGYLI
jgi:hypothetical protein